MINAQRELLDTMNSDCITQSMAHWLTLTCMAEMPRNAMKLAALKKWI